MTASRSRCRTLRSGFGLVDVVGMMIVIAMLLSLSAIVLNRGFVAHATALAYFQQQQNLQNAHNRFCNDAHSAVASSADENVKFTMPGGVAVVYSCTEDTLIRTLVMGDEPQGREIWQLPGKGAMHCTMDRSGRQPLVIVNLEFEMTKQFVSPIQWVTRTEFSLSGSLRDEIDINDELRETP